MVKESYTTWDSYVKSTKPKDYLKIIQVVISGCSVIVAIIIVLNQTLKNDVLLIERKIEVLSKNDTLLKDEIKKLRITRLEIIL